MAVKSCSLIHPYLGAGDWVKIDGRQMDLIMEGQYYIYHNILAYILMDFGILGAAYIIIILVAAYYKNER